VDLLNFDTSWKSCLEEGGANARLSVKQIQLEHGLGRNTTPCYLPSPSTQHCSQLWSRSGFWLSISLLLSWEKHMPVRSGCLHSNATGD